MKNFLLNDDFGELETQQVKNNHTSGYITREDTDEKLQSNQSTLARNVSSPAKDMNWFPRGGDLFNETTKMHEELSHAVNQVDTLRLHDLENTGHANIKVPQSHSQLPRTTADMIQNVNTDIDNFIQNAKIIQDSINEAITYDGANADTQEQMFRNSFKYKPQLAEIEDVSQDSQGEQKRDRE